MFRRKFLLFLFAPVVIFLRPISSPAAPPPNIILITLDSTRADRMGFLGSKAKLTPNLDGVAGQSIVFEQAYSQAPLTVVSHATILTGTYPQTHRANTFGIALAPTLPFAPRLLRQHCYHTAAFVGSIALDPKNGFAPGFDRGFTVYDAGFHPPARGQSRFISVERPGAQVVARASKWLAGSAQGPFFLWIHLNDPASALGAAYNAAITSADASVGKLIAALRARDLYDNTFIVIASDHGESLGVHGEESHGIFLYDETVRVPLVVKLPQNQSAGKRVRARASLVDIAPTLLEVAGVAVPSQMQGQSLLRITNASPNADRPAYSASELSQRAFGWSTLESWRAGKYLYIKAPRPELYDISSDPA